MVAKNDPVVTPAMELPLRHGAWHSMMDGVDTSPSSKHSSTTFKKLSLSQYNLRDVNAGCKILWTLSWRLDDSVAST